MKNIITNSNLESNFRLVVFTSSSPVTKNQEIKRTISFWGVWKSLQLCRCMKNNPKTNGKEKTHEHGVYTKTCHSSRWWCWNWKNLIQKRLLCVCSNQEGNIYMCLSSQTYHDHDGWGGGGEVVTFNAKFIIKSNNEKNWKG